MCSRIDRDGPGSPWTDDAVYDQPLLRLIRTNFSVRRSTIQSAPAVPAVGAFFWAVENTMGKSGKIIARHLVENHEAYSVSRQTAFGPRYCGPTCCWTHRDSPATRLTWTEWTISR